MRAALDRIQDTLPPIAGIAHAPMILQDALFENMDFESMKVVLEAKVQGGVYLDEYFDNQKPLDFFICFSSLAAVAGNSGQSNYTAANSFLATLTAQRKRRGLAGSCIDLSAVHGVGYIAKASRESNYELNPYTFVPISEQDVDELFAEAVIAGQPEKDGKPVEIITGIPNMEYKNREHIQSFDDTRISFWRLPNEESRSDQTASHGFLSVREKLMLAADIDGAFEVLKGMCNDIACCTLLPVSMLTINNYIDALAAKLRSIMRLPSTEPVDEDVPLIDQGVDSLVAVTLRTWLVNNSCVDIYVRLIFGQVFKRIECRRPCSKNNRWCFPF